MKKSDEGRESGGGQVLTNEVGGWVWSSPCTLAHLHIGHTLQPIAPR